MGLSKQTFRAATKGCWNLSSSFVPVRGLTKREMLPEAWYLVQMHSACVMCMKTWVPTPKHCGIDWKNGVEWAGIKLDRENIE